MCCIEVCFRFFSKPQPKKIPREKKEKKEPSVDEVGTAKGTHKLYSEKFCGRKKNSFCTGS